MPLIDASYFKGDIGISNIDKADILSKVNEFIAIYEPKCLDMILGYALSKKVQSNNSGQAVQNLIKGKEYTDSSGNLQNWSGIVYEQNGVKQSLIANYVWYFYQIYLQQQASTIGIVAVKGGKTEISDQSIKLVKAYNFFAQYAIDMTNFIMSNLSYYPDFQIGVAYNNYELKINSFGI